MLKREFMARIGIPLLIVVLLLAHLGCGEKENVYKIGAIIPITGNEASYGERQQQGFEIVLDEINSAGGINGKKIEILYEDSAFQVDKAITAFNRLKGRVKIIVGITGSSLAEQVAPLANRAKVVLVSALDSAPVLANAGPYFFSIMPSDKFSGIYLAEQVLKEGHRKASILYSTITWSQGMKESTTEGFTKGGGEIIYTDSFKPEELDFKTLLSKKEIAQSDVLFLFCEPKQGGQVIRQAREIGVEIPIYGGDAFSGTELGEVAGKYSKGVRFVFPRKIENEILDNFKKRYVEKYPAYVKEHGPEPDVYTLKSYDAMRLAIHAIQQVGYDAGKLQQFLSQVKDYQGASAKITFDENGIMTSPEFDIYEFDEAGKYTRIPPL